MAEMIKYYDCPECRGVGELMIARMYPTGHTECWDECEFCEGNGKFDEEEFLIMRLEGKA